MGQREKAETFSLFLLPIVRSCQKLGVTLCKVTLKLVLESMFNLISRLFVSYFRVDFCLFYAGNSGLFSNSTDKNIPKRATKSPKRVLAATE